MTREPRYEVARVPVERTLALRREVLRPHLALEEAVLPGDDDPATAAFAALGEDGEVLSVARVGPEPAPFAVEDVARAGLPEWRLRGMATRADLRGRGIGSAVLDAVIAHVAAEGGGLLWCNARVPAVGLYRRFGFLTWGEEWVEPVIGPHVVMWREVAPGAPPAVPRSGARPAPGTTVSG